MPKSSKKPTPKTAKFPAKAKAPVKVKKTTISPPRPTESVIAPTKPTSVSRGDYFYANGKRKTSIATVRLFKGAGVITINNRTLENFFPVSTDQDKILSPFRLTNTFKTFDVSVQIRGGGVHSQAEAVRHGISKALLEFDPKFRALLKPMGFLTRDSRVKERKKYGLHRARRGPQFSKR